MAKVFTLSQRVPLSALLSYSKELIMVLDNESRIIDVNDNFLSLLSLSRQETLGKISSTSAHRILMFTNYSKRLQPGLKKKRIRSHSGKRPG